MSTPTPITITLRQVENNDIYTLDWEKALEANGGVNANLDNPFPLSTLLDSNGLDDTIRCFRHLPEHKDLFVKFTLFCVKEAGEHTSDARVHDCIDTLDRYLGGYATLKELRDIATDVSSDIDEETVYDPSSDNAIRHTILLAATYAGTPYNATEIVVFIADASRNTAYVATMQDDDTLEKQKQIGYLRKLLDGEAVCTH